MTIKGFVGEIELDARRRASFGQLGQAEHTRYLVSEDEVGVLTLVPAMSVPITMISVRLKQAIAQADAGQLHPRP